MNPTDEDRECHAPKPILFATGRVSLLNSSSDTTRIDIEARFIGYLIEIRAIVHVCRDLYQIRI